jgi:hypothetical protein
MHGIRAAMENETVMGAWNFFPVALVHARIASF